VAKILIIDDDPALLDGLSTLIETRIPGVTVRTHTDPSAALDALAKRRYDLVIVTSLMPGMDGDIFIRSARQICPSIPMIMLSDHEHHDLEQKALDAGAWGFITKPIEREGFVQVVQEALESPRAAFQNRT
jgi:DNA-binding NarL/FixJ family response regulator